MQFVRICIFFLLFYFQAILAKHSVNEEEFVDELYGFCGAPPSIKPKEVQFVKGPPSRFKAGEPEFVNMKIKVKYTANVKNLEKAQLEQLKRSVEQSVKFYQKILKIRSKDRAETPKIMHDDDVSQWSEYVQKLHDQFGADFYLDVDYGCENSCTESSHCDGNANTIAFAQFLLLKNSTLPDRTFFPWHRRPIMGRCYICQGQISGRLEDYQRILTTVKHEILHALGFHHEYIQQGLKKREINWKVTEKRSWKKKVTYYSGPHTRDATRAHFGCPDLDGAEIEDAGGGGTNYHHWDKRAFGPEQMTGTISRKSYFSNITAAFLRDLGWYEVDDSMIDHEAYWYGKNKTCEFAMKSCRSFIDYAEKDVALQKLHAPAIPYCSEKHIQAWYYREQSEISQKNVRSPLTCSSDRSTYMQCRLTAEGNGGWNKSHYGYFSDKRNISKVHGDIKMLDFCPVFMDIRFEKGYDSVCSNVYNQPDPSNNNNAMTFGDSSLCFEQGQYFVHVNCSTWTSIFGGTEAYRKYAGAGCYDYKCSMGRLMIRPFAPKETEEIYPYKICWAPGAQILIRRRMSSSLFVTGTILCPKCEDICEGKNDPFKCAEPVYGVNPVDKITPTCSASRFFESLVILIMVILVQRSAQ